MRIIFAILLLSCIPALSQQPAVVGDGKSQKAAGRLPVYHNHPLAPLLFEDFESTSGYDTSGWGADVLAPGTINPDNTTNVIFGSQSLAVDESHDDPTCITNSFAASGHVYVAFRIYVTKNPSAGPYNTFLRLNAADNSCQIRVTLNQDMELHVFPGCGAADVGVGFPMSLNTIYIVWLEYFKDNGANSYASAAFSATPIKPTDPSGGYFAEVTGTSTATDVSVIQIGHNASENGQEVDFIIDHLVINNAPIISYP